MGWKIYTNFCSDFSVLEIMDMTDTGRNLISRDFRIESKLEGEKGRISQKNNRKKILFVPCDPEQSSTLTEIRPLGKDSNW